MIASDTQTDTQTDRQNDADENNTSPKTKFLGQVKSNSDFKTGRGPGNKYPREEHKPSKIKTHNNERRKDYGCIF